AESICVFIFAGLLAFLTGITGLFYKLKRLVPLPIACAKLAGLLFKFGLGIFESLQSDTFLVAAMLLTYLIVKCFLPPYVILVVLVVGVLFSVLRSD
ncbi:benzoate/H(+) symporter BenE family transporter, partial [Marinomonas sp. TI.3.20]|uniref:benzoate/H(+) symporter BenE family transporter n=1 Tax=Marinomonas sp. TI.3.20 TaxID=3121296 RepID=UPI00311E9A67